MSVTRRRFCQSALFAPTIALLGDKSGYPTSGQAPGDSPVANYMLRYLIRTETAKQQTEDLIANCHQNHIRHVILFSDNQWDMGWNLPTLEEARARVEVLRPVVQRLRSVGLHTSINMFDEIGHSEHGRDERQRFSWQFMVGDDGAESHCCPCPIDPKWKSYVGELFGLFARLEPEIIYIDDDFRYHNHAPVDWGCFCPLHLAEMARRTGKHLSREELAERILTAEPQPTEERTQWFKLCGDSMVEAARIMAEAVKEASPKTHMGLMCSDPDVHAAEGRRWLDMVDALSVSGLQPALRPGTGTYADFFYPDVARDLSVLRKLQLLLGSKMRFTPELENYPSTRFSKSVRLTRLHIALSMMLASPDITLDIHNIVETRFDIDAAVDAMLRDSFGYFSGVATWAAECGKERGLQVLWDDRFPMHRKVNGNRMIDLPAPRCWEGVMDLLGFATTFHPDEVKLASQSYLEERSDEEIRNVLHGKVLMDGDAATLLIKRGFGQEIGLKSCEPVAAANYEEMTNRDFAGRFLNRDETTVEAYQYHLYPVEQAIVVSEMFGPARSFSVPGMTLFENASGGRIGVIPQSGSRGDLYSVLFRGWKRQEVLKKMLEWINKGPLPLFVEDAPNVCPFRRDGEKAVLIAIANLSVDPLPHLNFQMARPFAGEPRIEYLTPEGKYVPLKVQATVQENYLYLRTSVHVDPLGLACFRLTQA
jgi:hypothetical protein